MSQLIYILIGVVAIIALGFGMAYIASYGRAVSNYYEDKKAKPVNKKSVLKNSLNEARVDVLMAIQKMRLKFMKKTDSLNFEKSFLKNRRQGNCRFKFHKKTYYTGLKPINGTGY